MHFSVNTSSNSQLQFVSHLQIDQTFMKIDCKLTYEKLRGSGRRHRLQVEELRKSLKMKIYPDWHKSPSALTTDHKKLSKIENTAVCYRSWNFVLVNEHYSAKVAFFRVWVVSAVFAITSIFLDFLYDWPFQIYICNFSICYQIFKRKKASDSGMVSE